MSGAAGALGIATAMATGVMAEPETPADSPPPASAPVAFKPISWFNERCGNCHGDYGSFWGKGFARDLGGDALPTGVEEMVEGPAQSHLDDKALAALVAYHRSLVDQAPFVILTRREGSALAGEVSPGAAVIIESGNQTVEAQVQGHAWSATFDGAEGTIVATKDRKTTRLPLAQWHSHAQAKSE